jgi:hypothetical protein
MPYVYLDASRQDAHDWVPGIARRRAPAVVHSACNYVAVISQKAENVNSALSSSNRDFGADDGDRTRIASLGSFDVLAAAWALTW